MTGWPLISAVIVAVLYVVVYRKAGFGGAILGVAALPLLTALAYPAILRLTSPDGIIGFETQMLLVVASLVSLTPLIVLALARWPQSAAHPSEK